MELFQLRYFTAAAKIGNFSRAAEMCHVAQPSLSTQIAALEKELGVALFVRAGRSVQLTDAGRVLLDFAEKMLRAEDEARRAVREVAGLQRGRLSLWTLPTPGQHLLPPLLARFRREYPGIALTVHEAVPARSVAEAVIRGEADIGLLHLPPTGSASLPVSLTHRELLTEELALVVPENHRFATFSPALADCASEDFVWVPEGETPEHPIYAACLVAGFTPRIVCVSGSASGMQALVAAGLGIALLPRLALHPPPGSVIAELAPPRPTRTLAVVWRKQDVSHAAKAFLTLFSCTPTP